MCCCQVKALERGSHSEKLIVFDTDTENFKTTLDDAKMKPEETNKVTCSCTDALNCQGSSAPIVNVNN